MQSEPATRLRGNKMPKRAQCIVFANHKGGTGKTTSCLSIAGFLARSGHKVLVVDFDPQANATSGLGLDGMSLRASMYDAVLDQCEGCEGMPITQVILETNLENIHAAPSELDLAVAEVIMQRSRKRTTILRRILEMVRPFYDYILIDLPPSSGLLTINGLCAADRMVVALDPSVFALEALENLKKSFHDVRRMARHSIHRITAVLVRYVKPDPVSRLLGSRNASQEIEARLKEMFDPVFIVPDSVEIYRAQKKGMPISHLAPGSRVGKAYRRIAESIATGGE